jgi:hypothetical protein
MNCKYRNEKEHPVCKLGMYGGMPSNNICNYCINNNQNNEEYAKQLFLLAEISHPSNKPRISGCCDSAKNYID